MAVDTANRSEKVTQVMDLIKTLNVMDLVTLVKAMEEEKVPVIAPFGERNLEAFPRSDRPRYSSGAEIHRDLQGVGKRQP